MLINYIYHWSHILIYLLIKLRHVGELPVTIDFIPYNRDPGYHNITIIANSTMREMADYADKFLVPGIHSIISICITYLI